MSRTFKHLKELPIGFVIDTTHFGWRLRESLNFEHLRVEMIGADWIVVRGIEGGHPCLLTSNDENEFFLLIEYPCDCEDCEMERNMEH